MTKTNVPLHSFGAKGSIGGILTYQEKSGATIIRAKPIPTDTKTLPQIYHRWLYQDYAALWNTLSDSTKQKYESDARRRRITGFNLWMSTRLALLPDIIAGYHLNHRDGATATDFSKNLHHGTIFGALHVDGYIDFALKFDGIDDYVNCGAGIDLAGKTAITLELWVNAYSLSNYDRFLDVRFYQAVLYYQNGTWRFAVTTDDAQKFRFSNFHCTTGRWVHLVGTYDGTTIALYVDGYRRSSIGLTGPIITDNPPTTIGIKSNLSQYPADAIIDEVRIYDRALSPSDILRHYLNYYPERS